jgi:hypothetical protein
MSVRVVFLGCGGKPPSGEDDVDLKNELDVAVIDEIKEGPSTLLLNAKHVEGGREAQRPHSFQYFSVAHARESTA